MMSRRVAIGVATMAALALAWYLATMPLGLISPGRFPSPADVWLALRQINTRGYANAVLYQHILQSLKLVVLGFLVAAGTGVPLGLLMG